MSVESIVVRVESVFDKDYGENSGYMLGGFGDQVSVYSECFGQFDILLVISIIIISIVR